MKKETSTAEDKKFFEKIERVEESLEALEKAGVDSIIVDSPVGHRFYTLVGSDQPLGLLVDTVNEAAACLMTDGTILYCNNHFAEVVNTPLQILTGKTLLEYVSVVHKSLLAQTLQNDKKGNLEIELVLGNGAVVPVYMHFSRITINQQDRVHVLLVEMSEKERDFRFLEEKNRFLEESLHSRDAFLAAMSHNLRTPLNSIIGFTDILLAKIPGSLNEEQEKQLEIVSRCSKQLLMLIRQLLDVGLIQHDKLEPVMDSFDVNQIISGAMQEVKPLADRKKIKLSATYLQKEFIVRTDKKLLRQVIINLLDNAIKYTEKGSVSVVEKTGENSSGAYLEIQVVDTGCGIRESDLTDIFKLYTTVSKKDDPYGEHTGLGLMLCCKYCELLGIKLTCDSIYGQGTSFIIQIPLGSKS